MANNNYSDRSDRSDRFERSDRADRSDRPGRPAQRRRPRRGCIKGVTFDYKEADSLRRYLNEYGRIRPRRQTRLCAKEQRNLALAVKRARHLALLPFVDE
ncbi:MAG: 30S ribosomal protein S18 [Anaerolineales bacterium]|nr:30S ribosomal protein S18 [Anaerolineales bacterium]